MDHAVESPRTWGPAGLFAVLALLSWQILLSSPALAEGPPAVASVPPAQWDVVLIQTRRGGFHWFDVELALTPEQQSRGLMFRRQMPHSQGMLFVWSEARKTYMWMKNTYLPLDMLFIRSDGVIDSIARNATPLSETIISSKGAVIGVLEIGGGLSRELDIQPGDRVVSDHLG